MAGDSKAVVEIQGKAFQLPEGCELIVVRAPADVDPDTLDGIKLEDLVEDDRSLTKQIAITYFESEKKGFRRVVAAKSYALVDKFRSEKAPKVVRVQRPPMIPPTGLKVCPLPYSVSNKEKAKTAKRKKRSHDEAHLDLDIVDQEKSEKKKKKKDKH